AGRQPRVSGNGFAGSRGYLRGKDCVAADQGALARRLHYHTNGGQRREWENSQAEGAQAGKKRALESHNSVGCGQVCRAQIDGWLLVQELLPIAGKPRRNVNAELDFKIHSSWAACTSMPASVQMT